MFREQMKTKSFLVLLLCILLTTAVVYLLGNETPNFAHQFVSETQRKIVNIDFKKLNTEIKSPHELSPANKKLLAQLGFVSKPRVYPDDVPHNVTPPVIVTSVTSSRYGDALDFVRSVYVHFPDTLIVMYGVDLSRSDNKLLSEKCNCSFEIFNFDLYPSHVGSLDTHAYRPIIIQECLNKYGAIIYLDVSVRVVRSDISELLKRAERVGVQAWASELDATTSFTHPKMFDFFGRKIANFYFHRMVSAANLVVYNSVAVHRGVMLPWIQCCLTENCVSPIGSQRSGCAVRRPLYLYRGCHRYDVSALNVALAVMYNYSVAPYEAPLRDTFFLTARTAVDGAANTPPGGDTPPPAATHRRTDRGRYHAPRDSDTRERWRARGQGLQRRVPGGKLEV